MIRTSDSSLRQLMYALRRELKTTHPVKVRSVVLNDGEFGDCELKTRDGEKYFIIRIHKYLSNDAKLFTIVHEYAHTLSWKEKKSHGPHWGQAYAKSWRVVCGEN